MRQAGIYSIKRLICSVCMHVHVQSLLHVHMTALPCRGAGRGGLIYRVIN